MMKYDIVTSSLDALAGRGKRFLWAVRAAARSLEGSWPSWDARRSRPTSWDCIHTKRA